MKTSPKKIFFFYFTVFAAFFLSGCNVADPLAVLAKTTEEITLESLAPKDSIAVFSYFPTTPEEEAFFQKHTASLFADHAETFSQNLHDTVAPELTNLLFEQRNSPFLISLHTDETRKSKLGFFAVMRLEKPEGFRLKLQNLKDTVENFTVTSKNNRILLRQEKPDLFGFFEEPYIALATSADLLPATLAPENPPLLQDDVYLTFLKRAPETFSGYAFFRSPEQVPASLFSKTAASTVFIRASKKGVRLLGHSKVLEDRLDLAVSELMKGGKTVLVSKIKSENPVLYLEGFNFASQLRLQKKLLLEDPFFAVTQGEAFFQSLESALGFSFENDLFPVLGGNYAFLIEEDTLSLFVDAGKNRESASKILKQIETFPLPIKIFANLTDDNIFSISTRERKSEKSVSEDGLYVSLLPEIRGFGETDFFFGNTEKLLTGFDQLFETLPFLKKLEALKPFIAPFKGLISGSKRSRGFVMSNTFLMIR